MIDYVKINLKSGKGGNGAVSFQRLRTRSYGRPDGGDGGDGGDLYLQVVKDLTTLLPYRYKKNFEAEEGIRGGKNKKNGRRGEDLFLPVPPGTKITDDMGQEFADLTKIGEKVMIVKGGKHGRGNAHIKHSDFIGTGENLAKEKGTGYLQFKDKWHWYEKGEETKEITVTLELKLLADIGLIGLPNAGKSTLLSKLTAATPKIASYAFTTLEPNLGVMRHKGKEVIVADIPGLIEGASRGRGLGDQFLRHVERTKILLHLISIESGDPIADMKTIDKELKVYSKLLTNKPQVYLLTKIDVVDLEDFKEKIAQFKKKKIKVLPISAVSEDGLEELRNEIIEKL